MDSYRYIEADDYYDMAMGWLKGRNRQKAEECLLKTLDLNPCFIHAYIDLAGLYARTDRYKDAVHVLKKATQHDPSFDRLHYLMAKYACRNGDYVNAGIFIGRAIDLNPRDLYLSVKDAIDRKYRSRPR